MGGGGRHSTTRPVSDYIWLSILLAIAFCASHTYLRIISTFHSALCSRKSDPSLSAQDYQGYRRTNLLKSDAR